MDLDVELTGLPQLEARLDHARTGILDLEDELAGELLRAAPPTLVHDSTRMHARLWGPGDVWTLPAGGWLAPRVQLPDGQAALTEHVQQLLDGS